MERRHRACKDLAADRLRASHVGAGSPRSGRATVARSGPACARILRNQSQGFGIRNALCAGESCNTELTTKAGETKVKKDRFGQVPAAGFVVSFGDGMNRTPIASPLLLVGRDATETWHGSDDEYREVGLQAVIAPLGIVGANFKFARAVGATQEAHSISYCRLLLPREI